MKSVFVDRDTIYISILHSDKIYKLYNEIGIHDILPYTNASSNGQYSPFIYEDNTYAGRKGCCVVEDWITKEQFFLRGIDENSDDVERYTKMVFDQNPSYKGLWPVDIVKLTKVQSAKIKDYVRRQYDEVKKLKFEKCRYALVFSCKSIPEVYSVGGLVSQVDDISHRDRRIRCLALNIVKAIDMINCSGYCFYDIHFSRFFVSRNDGSVYLDFSELIYRKEEMISVKSSQFPLEFAYPALVIEEKQCFAYWKQNYSLAAMLFYLLVNRYAYDSDDVEYTKDNDIIQHYQKMIMMAKTHKFIFDSDNLPSHSVRNAKTKEIWDELPDDIRFIFENTLSYKHNAKRRETRRMPSPREWIELFCNTGWCSFCL